MRILYLIESLGRAGAEQALVNLLPAMQERGQQCEVAVLFPPYELEKDLEAAGVRVHRLNGRYERRWDALRLEGRLLRLLRQRQPDVIHAHLLFADIYAGLSKLISPRALRVASFHNTDFDFLTGKSPTAMVGRHLLPFVLRRYFDGLTAVSRPVLDHYQEHIPGLPITWIPNAFPTTLRPQSDLDRDAVLAPLGLSASDFVLITVARLAPEKGHRFLLEALQQLGAQKLHPKVLLIGAGPLRDELQRDAQQRGLASQVIFAETRPHQELLPIVQAADAFVLPSVHEGFGLAPAEAMLLQRPVLVTSAGGLMDVVKNEVSGLVVPPANAHALAQGLHRLMTDDMLRNHLALAGRQYILERFGAPVVARQWEEFYLSLRAR
ncbi:MAG: hypothetical protein JWN98_424 [Abditibacteriota bacterium]|nr:hypothetical protein [Abditibacteriota bacterium]